jgi:hypothetical protein
MRRPARWLLLASLGVSAPALADELLTGELKAPAPGHISIGGKTVPLLSSTRESGRGRERELAGTLCYAAGDPFDCSGLYSMGTVGKARVTLRGAHALKIEILEP